MWIAVVPASNEAFSVGSVIENIFLAQIDLLLLVANGCTDETCTEAIHAAKGRPLKILSFPRPLGVDIPKAVGAVYALQFKPSGVIFVDGDMRGPLLPVLVDLVKAVREGLDLALTNCYPFPQQFSQLAEQVLLARETLNRRLGLFSRLGTATPSHGPHAYSSTLLNRLDLRNLAIPPLALVQAALLNAGIGIGAAIPHISLGSPPRSLLHAEKIAETIIGDCQEALELLGSSLPSSCYNDIQRGGYRYDRRFDILERLLESAKK